jgi:SAM-dependent methyltransferase
MASKPQNLAETSPPPYFSHEGHCEICEAATTFKASGPNFRSTLRCPRCNTPPRERALYHALSTLYPNWRELKIHESSPNKFGVSAKLATAAGYTESQYDPEIPWGTIHPTKGYRSEDLEAQKFADESFDLVITQDVFEHLFHPDRAIKEIARTLRPGGAHICTFPITQKTKPTRLRASLVNNEIVHHLPPSYHGNPVAKEALMTIDWGYDVASYLMRHSGLSCWIWSIDKIDLGIRADFNEVVICHKVLAKPALY